MAAQMWDRENSVQERFAIAEGLVRLALSGRARAPASEARGLEPEKREVASIAAAAAAGVSVEVEGDLFMTLFQAAEKKCLYGRSSEKNVAVVVLLVLMTQAASTDAEHLGNCNSSSCRHASPPTARSAQLVKGPLMLQATELFLRFLQEKDAFVQDVSCMGLCQLFHHARQSFTGDYIDSQASRSLTLAEKIAQEVRD